MRVQITIRWFYIISIIPFCIHQCALPFMDMKSFDTKGRIEHLYNPLLEVDKSIYYHSVAPLMENQLLIAALLGL